MNTLLGRFGQKWTVKNGGWPLQYCKIISLQLIKINGKNKNIKKDKNTNRNTLKKMEDETITSVYKKLCEFDRNL